MAGLRSRCFRRCARRRKEAIEQASVGALQMASVSVGAIGPVIDELNVLNMPIPVQNTAHARR